MKRTCEKCSQEMPAGVPRQRVAGLFVCSHCANSNHKIAHDMSARDPLIIRHCSFCGSGQVVARNDGSVECDFCQSVFTVRVEPFYPGWPQTVNGVPQNIPLHPNESTDNAGAFDENMNNSQVDPGGFGAGFYDGEADEDQEEDAEAYDDEADEDDFDFQTKSMLSTAYGGKVDEEAYIKHLAIRLSDPNDRDRVIDMIRMV